MRGNRRFSGAADIFRDADHYYGVFAAVCFSARGEKTVFADGVRGGVFADWRAADGAGDYSWAGAGDLQEAAQAV
jgi:hypothetical protein